MIAKFSWLFSALLVCRGPWCYCESAAHIVIIAKTIDPEPSHLSINSVDCYHYPDELLSGVTRRSIASVATFSPREEHRIMKRHLLLSLTLSVLAANAFALPAEDQHLSAESRSSAATVAQPLNTLAEGGAERLQERAGRVAEGGSDRLIERNNRVAEGGSDRLIERNNRVAEGGSDRLIERNNRVAEGGSDRLIERNNRVAEGGSDRLIERNNRVAEGGSDRLVELSRVS
jgi:hypothetical protein